MRRAALFVLMALLLLTACGRLERGPIVRVDFGFRSGGESRVFLYRRGGAWLLEQPFQGVWQVDASVWDFLKEVE